MYLQTKRVNTNGIIFLMPIRGKSLWKNVFDFMREIKHRTSRVECAILFCDGIFRLHKWMMLAKCHLKESLFTHTHKWKENENSTSFSVLIKMTFLKIIVFPCYFVCACVPPISIGVEKMRNFDKKKRVFFKSIIFGTKTIKAVYLWLAKRMTEIYSPE